MYRKDFYVFDENGPTPAVIRNYMEPDFEGLIRIQQESFPPPFSSELLWNKEQLSSHVNFFAEGALCIEVNGELAGSITGLVINFDPAYPDHTWKEITDDGYIRSHQPNGNTLYVVDIGVRPMYRKAGLGKWLMSSMYDVVIYKGLDRLLGGGRMPGYQKHAGKMTPEQYVDAIVKGELKDPVLTFLLRCGRTPVKVIRNYIEDEESFNCGALMEWKNPFTNR
ncbi:GNAT family N-acetyltransferase [Bacillus sp. SJS]|uniref:GNAT family N-acetyltransferase n=1 Tax=Bacillus sp. SJS TaxID=1423321 RepID=UPI0004DD5345|nr:GNAT family N-acetyltransferase [Bacillus sp. SJS]KZZ85131.1 acetyltransferase [Bacillus sp. SJS]